MTSTRRERLPLQARDASPCFGHDQRPAGDIPRFQVALPEAVHAPGGDPAQVDGGGSESADGARASDERAEQADDFLDARVHVVRKAGHEHGVEQFARVGCGEGHAVQERAAAALGGEQLAPVRIVDGCDLGDAVDLEGQRRAEDRQAVRVVGRAVERIEYPAGTGRRRGRAAHFFREDVVIGKAFGDERAKHFLDGDIDFGDEVDRAFLVDLHAAAERGHLHVAGAHDRLDGRRHEQRIRHRCCSRFFGPRSWFVVHRTANVEPRTSNDLCHLCLNGSVGGVGGLHALDHADFHAAFGDALQLHVVHEIANEEDAAAARFQQILRREGIRHFFGFEAFTLIADADAQFGNEVGGRGFEFDEDVFRGVVPVAVFDRVDDRFANGDADPVERIVVEADAAAHVIADDLHEVHHLEDAVEFETDCPAAVRRHAPPLIP